MPKMPGLLNLSHELILSVVSLLKPEPPNTLAGGPFDHWNQILQQKNIRAFALLQDVHVLVRSCRHLRALLTPTLYEYIPLLDGSDRTRRFLRSLRTNETLRSYVRHASINVSYAKSVQEFHEVFRLPRIRYIDIKEYKNYELVPWDEHDDLHQTGQHSRISPVRVMRLVECGAHRDTLHELLAFPASLKELWLEIDHYHWSEAAEENPADNFRCEDVQYALREQNTDMVKLVMTRANVEDDSAIPKGPLDFSGFTALKSLCIAYTLLDGDVSAMPSMREQLPPLLEELEVYYDELGNQSTGFGSGLGPDSFNTPDWLFDILAQPGSTRLGAITGGVPHLKSIRVISLEWYPDRFDEAAEDDDGTEDIPELDVARVRTHPDCSWRPRAEILRRFAESPLSKLSWSIFIHPEKRCAYVPEGGAGFDDEWEDSWVW